MERLGVGVIGVGRTARAHAQACAEHPLTELRAVAELDEAKGRAFAEKHQIAWVDDYRALLARPDVAIAVILLP
ncbi:MAG TPA: Gfo/Idh/MocA family oxidoreductase, partial [Limnochordia bacterium]|nr:Gfo/Idh/MocA family oxidoreductase [Limnochordia bacterium]